MNSRVQIKERLMSAAVGAAEDRGADSPFDKAFDALEILAYMVSDMIGPDGEQKDLAFKAALVIGGKP